MRISSAVVLIYFTAGLCLAWEFDKSFYVCKHGVVFGRFYLWYKDSAKRLATSAQIFPCFTNIYKCYGLWPLYCLCFECQSFTSTFHLPQIHQNIWSDNVLPSHSHLLKWLDMAIFNKMWWRLMLNLPF